VPANAGCAPRAITTAANPARFDTKLRILRTGFIPYQTEQKEAEEMVGIAHPTFLKLI
jgi:hypothetical protein